MKRCYQINFITSHWLPIFIILVTSYLNLEFKPFPLLSMKKRFLFSDLFFHCVVFSEKQTCFGGCKHNPSLYNSTNYPFPYPYEPLIQFRSLPYLLSKILTGEGNLSIHISVLMTETTLFGIFASATAHFWIFRPAHYTLNTTHYTLHAAHCTLHTAHHKIHTTLCTLHTIH